MKELIRKYKKHILYLIYGGATTLINILIFNICYYHFAVSNFLSNIISWILSVLFAYVTNKLFVFQNKNISLFTIIRELMSFVLYRVMTGIIDVFIMYISVDLLRLVAWKFKIVSNIIVIICNYIASKKIFSERRDCNEKSRIE